jgi:hypothetical protein
MHCATKLSAGEPDAAAAFFYLAVFLLLNAARGGDSAGLPEHAR